MSDPTIKTAIIHSSYVSSLCFSPTQPILCSVGGRKAIMTSLENKKTEKVFEDPKIGITGSSFSFDGKSLATCNAENIRIWDVENGTHFELNGEGRNSSAWVVKFFHGDSNRIVSGSFENTIKIWELERKTAMVTLTCEGMVLSVDLLPNNNTLVSGDLEDEIRIFDLRTEKCEKVLKDNGPVTSVRFNPNNSHQFVSGSKTIKIWDIRNFKTLHSFDEDVNCVDFHHSGRFLISGSCSDCTVKLFDLEDRKVLYTLRDHKDGALCVCFSPNGNQFASGSMEKKAFLWDFPLGKEYELKVKESEKERTEKILSDKEIYPTFPILLSNKKVNLWKSLLDCEEVFEENTTEYDMRDYKLSITEEETLLKIMMGDSKKIPTEHLGDHFILFRHLKMKFETKVIIDQILQIEDLGDCYKLFSSFCENHENSTIQQLFSHEKDHGNDVKLIKDLSETSFETSFALQLFIRMKELKEQYSFGSPLFLLNHLGRILYHADKSEDLNIFKHPDYIRFDLEEFEFEAKMKKLRRGLNSNLLVKSSDEKQFPVHREILSYKSNFFSKMFSFLGREREEILKNGTMQLEVLKSDSFEFLLDLIYFGEVVNFEAILPLFVHLHMYQEEKMFQKLLNFMRILLNPGNLKEILEKEGVGSTLFGNEELLNILSPILSKIDSTLTRECIERELCFDIQSKLPGKTTE